MILSFFKPKFNFTTKKEILRVHKQNLIYINNCKHNLCQECDILKVEITKIDNQIKSLPSKDNKEELSKLKVLYTESIESLHTKEKEISFLDRCYSRVESLIKTIETSSLSEELIYLSNKLNAVVKGREPESFYSSLFKKVLKI